MPKTYEFPREFLDLVRTMPFVEADELLRDRRQEVVGRLRELPTGSAAAVDLGYILSALNDELKLLHNKMQRITWSRAVRDVFGQEGWDKVREHVVMLEMEAAKV